MKIRIYHIIFVCVVLIVFLVYFIRYPVLCWVSVTPKTGSYLLHLTDSLCPSINIRAGTQFISYSNEPRTLGLVSKLWNDEVLLERAHTTEKHSCGPPKPLSESSTYVPVSCKPLHPHQNACRNHDQRELNCNQELHVICELKVNSLMPTIPDILCHDICQSPLYLGVINGKVDQVTWITVSQITKLQSQILHLINPLITEKSPSGFCFIQCNLKDSNKSVTQLLVLPPNLTYLNRLKDINMHQKAKHHLGPINFNIVIIDGISRTSFWRQLPTVTGILKKLQKSRMKLLDFSLVQGLDDMNSLLRMSDIIPENDETLFKTAVSNDYQTLWLTNGCHYKKENISRVVRWMSQAYILDAGPSIAFCQAKTWHGVESPCFNGIPLHSYLFKYLRYYQAVLAKFRQPYLSTLHLDATNGQLSIASLDKSLSHYIEFSAHQSNTMTIIITYPDGQDQSYPEYVLNGAKVLFHPIMFVVMPQSVQQYFLDHSMFMLNLVSNQNKLITTQDLYKSLKYIMSSDPKTEATSKQLGLLGAVSQNRSCADLLISHTTCICDGFEVQVSNKEQVMSLAEYAVSQLNAMLQRQFDAGSSYLREIGYRDHVVSSCHRLLGKNVLNISQALTQNDKVLTWMTIEVESLRSLNGQSDINQTVQTSPNQSSQTAAFRTVLEHSAFVNTSSLSINMRLISYKRLGQFSMYNICTGGLISSDLCLCQPAVDGMRTYPVNRTLLQNMQSSKANETRHRKAYSYFDPKMLIANTFHQFGYKTEIHCVDPNAKNKCLFVIYRTYNGGAHFEAVNICPSHAFDVGFSVRGENLCYSGSLAIIKQVAPLSVLHLVTVVKHKVAERWSMTYQVQFQECRLS